MAPYHNAVVTAAARLEACRAKLPPDGPGYAQYVVGPKGKYEILEIDSRMKTQRACGIDREQFSARLLRRLPQRCDSKPGWPRRDVSGASGLT